MVHGLKILIADDEESIRRFLTSTLNQLGHQVVSTCSDGDELIRQAQQMRPDLIITDVIMPKRDGLEAAKQLYETNPTPIIIITAFPDEDFIQRAADAHVLGYLLKPVTASNIIPAIEIAMRRFVEFQALQIEAESLRHALKDRKLIERAKGLMMKQAKIDEQEAFQRLQKLARDSSKKLVEIARMIILSAEAMKPPE